MDTSPAKKFTSPSQLFAKLVDVDNTVRSQDVVKSTLVSCSASMKASVPAK